MSWKQRGKNRYSYRSVRDGARVRSEYIGAGRLAVLVAELTQRRRKQRQQKGRETQCAP